MVTSFSISKGPTRLSYERESCKLAGSLREYVLFMHTFSGCDTISEPFGKGKVRVWNMLEKSDRLRKTSEIMNDPWAEQDQVGISMTCIFT